MKNSYQYFLLLLLTLSACKDPWEEHNALQDPALGATLLQLINKDPQLSQFSAYLVQTGYDKTLAASKTLTVWAPDNQALEQLPAAITGDTASLRQFIGLHIATQSYYTHMLHPMLRIKTLCGKYVDFTVGKFETATVTAANKVAGNGVLHVIDQPVLPVPNVWEQLQNSSEGDMQKHYLQNLDYRDNDSIIRNRFLERILPLDNEGGQYTLILLTDDAMTGMLNRQLPFFTGAIPEVSQWLTSWNIVKDLAFAGAYTPDQLPDTLTSTDHVKVHIDKNAIVATHKASNGIIYVLNRLDYRLSDKIKTLIIEGEQPAAFSHERRINTFYRVRKDSAGLLFNDIMVQNHRTAFFSIRYQLNNAYSARYKVYWRAVNDIQTVAFRQRLVMDSTTAPGFPYTVVNTMNYQEIYLGEYTKDSYGNLNLYLVADGVATDGLNTLTLDYIKLAPVLE